MNGFRNILFFADGSKGEQRALESALELAEHNKARLTVMDVVAEVGTNDPRLDKSMRQLQKSLSNERKEKLGALLDSVKGDATVRTSVRVVSADKDFVGIIRAIGERGYDLLVKAASRTGALSSTLFGNTDWALMRQCPCPVWLIKPGRKKRINQVLAAVDLTTDEPSTLQLAKRLIELSAGIAEREQATVHVLTSWDHLVEADARKQIASGEYESLLQHYKAQIHQRFEKLLAPYKDAQLKVGAFKESAINEHIVRGKPAQTISRFVASQNIDLLVMGTLSRSGIPGLLVGNTAEKVLNNVNCSVLTLKPENFQTAIT